MNRLALTVPLATAAILATPALAAAHTPTVSASCSGVHVQASNYDATKANRWSVTIGGTEQHGTFAGSYDQTFVVPQQGATTHWAARVEASDGTYVGQGSGDVGPCGTPPVVKAPQPSAVVTTSPVHEESCALGGSNDSTTTTTTPFVYDAASNTWVKGVATTVPGPVVFTAYTPAELVSKGCVKPAEPVPPKSPPPPPAQPPAVTPVSNPVLHHKKPHHHKHTVVTAVAVTPTSTIRPAASVAPVPVLPNTGLTETLARLALVGIGLLAAGVGLLRSRFNAGES